MGYEQKNFYLNYDLGATTLVYGRVVGRFDQGRLGAVSTVGSSTTLTSTVAGTKVFAAVIVGDLLEFTLPGTAVVGARRRVTAKASDESLTLSSAIDLSAGCTAWNHLPYREGTAVTDGWHNVESAYRRAVKVDIATLNAAGGLDISIECRGREDLTAPAVVLTKNYAAATSDIIEVTEPSQSIRVGVKGNSGFAGTDDISIGLLLEPRRS